MSQRQAGWVEYTLPEGYDASIFNKVVQFMYTGRYDDEEHQNCEGSGPRKIWHMSAEAINAALHPSGRAANISYMIWFGHDEEDDADWDMDVDGESESEDGEGDDESEDEAECSRLKYESDGDDTAMAGDAENKVDVLSMEIAELAIDQPEHDHHVHLPNALATSVQVFTMADQFGIPALKLFAKDRFYRSAERNVTSLDFAECVDKVYSDTGGTDLSLLKEIIVLFIHSVFELNGPVHLRPILKKHAELSYDLLRLHVDDEGLINAIKAGARAYHDVESNVP